MASHHQMAAIAHNDRNNSANGVRNEIGPILPEHILRAGLHLPQKIPKSKNSSGSHGIEPPAESAGIVD
jgi:hypothetical protein